MNHALGHDLKRECGKTAHSCSELLFGSDVGGVTALSLSAVCCLGRKSGIALSANHLFALVLSGKGGKRGLNGNGSSATTSESENQVEC